MYMFLKLSQFNNSMGLSLHLLRQLLVYHYLHLLGVEKHHLLSVEKHRLNYTPFIESLSFMSFHTSYLKELTYVLYQHGEYRIT